MKKIPTLFERVFEDHRKVDIFPNVTVGMEWVLKSEGTATEKIDGSYEVIGPHFRNNPYKLEKDILVRHGEKVFRDVPRSFEGIKEYLDEHCMEGIVFWKDGEPGCKIKRSDFGYFCII